MRSSRRRRRNNRTDMLSICCVVLIMVVVMFANTRNLQKKVDSYSQRIQVLEEKKEMQLARQEELEEYARYVQTKKYVEEVAKDKLGLVYEDEIIFKAKE